MHSQEFSELTTMGVGAAEDNNSQQAQVYLLSSRISSIIYYFIVSWICFY
jgi:hypothetical protein